MEMIGTSPRPTAAAAPFLATSPAKFIAMSVCTFGLYEAYWSYKNWTAIKKRDGSAIIPIGRAIFYPLWHFSLMTELDKSLESDALSGSFLRGLLAASVLVLNATNLLPDPYWLISMLTFVGFMPALLAMREPESSGPIHEPTKTFHPSNLIAYFVGGPAFAFVVLSTIGFFPSTAIVTGDDLWNRDIEYLRQTELLGPDEEIIYFYSDGFLSIASDGQFISNEYVTSYVQDPDDGETYLDFASYHNIDDINVSWSDGFLGTTVVTISKSDDSQFELWLSSENDGDRLFVDAMKQIWNKVKTRHPQP